MADEPKVSPGDEGGQNGSHRWRNGTAGLIVVVSLGLVVWQTYATGEIPYQILLPLLGAALWAIFNFSVTDFTGRK